VADVNQMSFLEEGGEQGGSPIRRQYLDIKHRYPDAILLFRLGDFYETFDDDAYLVSSELEIALTGRDMGRGERVPLAGIPYHAAEGYIARLLAKGHKIALAEQMGTPGRGLMAREVVRVITPGTLIEDALLPARGNNYLASMVVGTDGAALALVDISTGEFSATEIQHAGWQGPLAAELERARPAECLLPRSLLGDPSIDGLLSPVGCVTPMEDATYAAATCERILQEQFHVSNLDGFGLDAAPMALRAAGSLLAYLRETQPASLGELESLHLYSLDSFMKLDAAARRHLELTANLSTGTVEGSLLGVLDRTRTPMGGRLLRRWIGQPLLEPAAIESRLDAVEEIARTPLGRAEMADSLSNLGDLERLASRAAQQSLSPRDCLAIARSLRAVPKLLRTLGRWLPGLLRMEAGTLDPCAEACEAIEATIAEDAGGMVGQGIIRGGRSAELDELRAITGDTRRWIAGLERSERERTGVRSLKIGYNKVFGYYIEVTRPNLEAPTDEYARMKTGATTVGELLEALGYQRKQTLANAERFVTPQLKDQEIKLNSAQEEIEALEKQIYAELLAELAGMAARIRGTAQSIARLDVLLSLAEVAVAGRYVRPTIDHGTAISLRGGRHPVVERSLPAGEYVPNDCDLDSERTQIALLTGPNMAGKSTYVLGVALIVLMAQMGSFVPAEEARIGVVDRIFTRVGAQHDVSGGKSTFLVEMAETANVLHNATPRSLVVLDEIGRGTSTYDGMAIARAVIEYIHDEPRLRCKTLFATHYHELTELEGLLPRVRNLRMDVLEEGDRVVFLHRVVPGGADRSYGIHVAQLAGVPAPVIRRAREILRQLEAGGDRPAEAAPPFGARDLDHSALLDELRSLDVARMTPLEAIAKLDELQKRVLSSES
jgi:DNA mismatch repair protein MutS